MKAFLVTFLSLSFLSSNLLAADTGLIARYKFSVESGKSEINGRPRYTAYIAELYSDKKLVVQKVLAVETSLRKEIINLASPVYDLLNSDVLMLAQAEIVTSFSPVVCMMMPLPSMTNDFLEINREFRYDAPEFGRDLLLVDGPKGCWNAQKTYPKEEYQREAASLLKRSLKVLSLKK